MVHGQTRLGNAPQPPASSRAQMCETFSMADWAVLRCQMRSCVAGRQGPSGPRTQGLRGTTVQKASLPGRWAVFAPSHPNSRPPRGTHLARGAGGETSRFSDAGTSPLSGCLVAGRLGAADRPLDSWARRFGVRAGGCSHVRAQQPSPRLVSPSPSPGSPRLALPGTVGLPALAPLARTRT